MSAEFLQELVAANMPTLAAIVNNGTCRFLAEAPGAVDEQGFITNEKEATSEEWLPCSWSIKASSESAAGENVIAGQPRSHLEYEITISPPDEETALVIESHYGLELKKTPDADAIALEISAVISQNEVAWFIRAQDLNA